MTLHWGPLCAVLRECWVDAGSLRLSATRPDWTDRPTIHAVVIESVTVEEPHRRQGHFRRFLAEVCAGNDFELVVVEGVQNPALAEALSRWGWEVDVGVMDFYKRTVLGVGGMGLFELGKFVLHSGGCSSWRINCDALSDEDIDCLAFALSKKVGVFASVEGVPRGGLRLARALEQFCTGTICHLIVDDVLTTGGSLQEMRARYPGTLVKGAVIFARSPCPDWVVPLFEDRA